MARKERKDNSKLREMMAEYGVKTMEDVHNFVKMLTAETRIRLFSVLRRKCAHDVFFTFGIGYTVCKAILPGRPGKAEYPVIQISARFSIK